MAAFTPFPPSSPPADSITAKGNLLTSNGTDQAEFTACADGEILEWDSAEVLGFKCSTRSPRRKCDYVAVSSNISINQTTYATEQAFNNIASGKVTTLYATHRVSGSGFSSDAAMWIKIRNNSADECETVHEVRGALQDTYTTVCSFTSTGTSMDIQYKLSASNDFFLVTGTTYLLCQDDYELVDFE